jgi:hypothetical protein
MPARRLSPGLASCTGSCPMPTARRAGPGELRNGRPVARGSSCRGRYCLYAMSASAYGGLVLAGAAFRAPSLPHQLRPCHALSTALPFAASPSAQLFQDAPARVAKTNDVSAALKEAGFTTPAAKSAPRAPAAPKIPQVSVQGGDLLDVRTVALPGESRPALPAGPSLGWTARSAVQPRAVQSTGRLLAGRGRGIPVPSSLCCLRPSM